LSSLGRPRLYQAGAENLQAQGKSSSSRPELSGINLIIWGISALEIEQVVNLSNLIIWVGAISFKNPEGILKSGSRRAWTGLTASVRFHKTRPRRRAAQLATHHSPAVTCL
jgi:hypothetical protein